MDERAELFCPRCRHLSDGEVVAAPLAPPQRGGVLYWADLDDLAQLQCTNLQCRQPYPVIDGIPVLLPASAELPQLAPGALFGGRREMEAQAALLRGVEPEQDGARAFARMARYAWSAFRDGMPAGVQGPLGATALPIHVVDVGSWLAAEGAAAVGRVLSLGCGLAREPWEVAASSVTLMDAYLPALQASRRLAREGELWVLLPMEPGRWAPVQVQMPVPLPAVRALCADVCDPPLGACAFDTVLMLNLVDSVHNPHVALGQACALLAPGGHLALSTPFTWRAQITAPARWTNAYPGVLDSAAGLALDMAYLGEGLRLVAERAFLWGLWSFQRELRVYESAGYLWRRESAI